MCSVPRTRWPVSDAVMASEMVSRSRISPTMMTSGSSRSEPRSAAPKDFVWVCTSRWVMWQPFGWKTYSIGILERDDVLVPLEVHLLDERGQRGRFAGADRAGDEDEAVVIAREQLEALRQAELVHRADVGADDAEDDVDPEPLPNDAGAEAPELGRVGEIDVAAFGELGLLAR